jgi:superfamily II DNA or RNA helicase
MSIKININEINDENREKINDELQIIIKNESNFIPDKIIQPYDIINNDIYLPFGYASTLGYKRPIRTNFSSMNVKFEGDLRPEQKLVKEEALNYLNKTGSIIISIQTGGGKTVTSICMACNIKLKTLIIVNKIVLMKQWEQSILQFCPTSQVQKLTTKTKKKDSDFFIMNAINISKMGREFYKDIGLLIVDECHLIMADTLSKSLQFINPRYLIGLSATPYRNDGLDPLINLFFGEHKIIRELRREHTIYKVDTGIKIELEVCESTKKVDWNAVLKTQSENSKRNDLIVEIIKHFKDLTFIVLCKRLKQASYIFKKLKESGEYVDNLMENKQEFDRECRVLVSIQFKTGVGFDWPKANSLLLASDTSSYFIQNLGRVFRRVDTTPIVFDIVDDNFILLKHYRERKKVYDSVGGQVKSFNKYFPELLK